MDVSAAIPSGSVMDYSIEAWSGTGQAWLLLPYFLEAYRFLELHDRDKATD